MSTSDSTVKGKMNEAVGSAKQSFGEAIGNDKLANEGAAEQVKGHAQEAWGSVKEGFNEKTEYRKPEAEHESHDIREKITSTAQNVKEHIQAGVDHLRDKVVSHR